MLSDVQQFEDAEDRLELLAQIMRARIASVYSSNNWLNWLNNIIFLDSLSDDQLIRIRNFWIDIALKMLEFDEEITSEIDEANKKTSGAPLGVV